MTRVRFRDVPQRISALPVDRRGYPVPKFVKWIDSEPDFRVMDTHHLMRCVRHQFCWICGERLGRHQWFCIGPMCAVNRISSEPPSHYECVRFAVEACPFLAMPKASRREANLPVHQKLPGMIEHNPGVALLWRTSGYTTRRVGDGLLFEVGEPTALEAYAHGRPATRAEVDAAVAKGLPFLNKAAAADGPDAVRQVGIELRRAVALFDRYCPEPVS